MANLSKLKKIMKDKNISEQMLSDKLDIKLSKLNDQPSVEETCFTIGEADMIVRLLGLDAETATEIFFES